MEFPVENTTSGPIYVGGKMIPPGETFHFNEEDLPPEYKPSAVAAEDAEPIDPLVEITALKLVDLKNGLPALSDEELDRLELLEVERQNRKGAIAAITEERLRRAEIVASGEKIASTENEGSGSGAGSEGEPGADGGLNDSGGSAGEGGDK